MIKRNQLLTLACMFLTLLTSGQQSELQCIAEYPEDLLRQLKAIQRDTAAGLPTGRDAVTSYPVTAFIIRQSDGTGGMDPAEFETAIDQLNERFAGAAIEFFLCPEAQFIDSDQFYEFNKLEENDLVNAYQQPNTINLYVPNSVSTPSGTSICGYADFPGWGSKVIIARTCAADGVTLSHEFGHTFGLGHTHGNSNVSQTDELVSALNCAVAGDDICDTPADPNLYEQVDTNCVYTGNAFDPEGNPYQPATNNIMSYAPKQCQTGFTEEQLSRIQAIGRYMRKDLICASFSAEFQATPLLSFCENAVIVEFEYTGNGATQFAWDVNNDGITDYTTPIAIHEYTETGNFDVSLTVSNSQETIQKTTPALVQFINPMEAPYSDPVSNYSGPISIINPDGNLTWEIKYLGPLLDSNNCWMVDNYHYNNSGQTDYLTFGPFEVENITEPYLSFDISYAPYNFQRSDALKVEISTDCGETFQQIYYKEGLELGTAGGYYYYQWLPLSAGDWRNENIDISEYVSTDPITIRFNNITDFGNNLYLDNIEIGGQQPLAIDLLSFQGKNVSDKLNIIYWETATEDKIELYILERSQDGIHFTELDRIKPQHALHNVYRYEHRFPPSNTYYRLTAIETDGSIDHSHVIHISTNRTRQFSIFPNPVRDILHLDMPHPTGTYSVMIFDQRGSLISEQKTHPAPAGSLTIDVRDLTPGLYSAKVGPWNAVRFMKVD